MKDCGYFLWVQFSPRHTPVFRHYRRLSKDAELLNYVSCVLFEIVGFIWRLSLCFLLPAVSSTLLASVKSVKCSSTQSGSGSKREIESSASTSSQWRRPRRDRPWHPWNHQIESDSERRANSAWNVAYDRTKWTACVMWILESERDRRPPVP